MKNQNPAAGLFKPLLNLTLIAFFLFFCNNTYAAAKTWTGNTSTAWATATNWSGNTLPAAADDITIPVRIRMPLITTGTLTVRSIIINSGATLTMSGGTLSIIGGSLQITGTFTATAGTVYSDRDLTVRGGGNFRQSGTSMLRLAKDATTNPGGSLVILSGGTVTQSGGTMYVKDYTASPGIFNQTGATALFKLFRDWKPGATSVFNSTNGTVEFAGNSRSPDFVSGTKRQFTNILIDAGVSPGFDNVTRTWGWWTGAGIYISGNFTNNNTALNVSSGATFIFNGSGTQNIYSAVTSTSNSTFGNLYINKPSGVALLTTNANVSGLIDIRNGTLDLSTYTCNNVNNFGFLYIESSGIMRLSGNTGGQTGSNFPKGIWFAWIVSKSIVEYYGTAQTIYTTTYGNLVVSAAGTKTAVGNLNIVNSFTLSTSTFIAGSYNHNVGENWTMTSGVFTNTGNTFTFNGRGVQNIASTPTGTFNKITINKPSGATNITTDITANTLNFVKGIVKTSANKMIIPQGGTVTGAAQTTGWVNGNLQKYHGTTAGGNYEIGTALNYSPLSITFASLTTPGNLIGSATATPHPNVSTATIKSRNISRYWTLTKPATGAVAYTTSTITFNWNTVDNYTPMNTANLGVANYNAALWSYPVMTGTRTTTSVTCTGVAKTGDFAVGEIIVCTGVSSFSYGGQEFCTNGGNADVVLNAGASAGTFTATPAGLSLKSNNGQIKLSGSTPGTYTVTNTVTSPGPCTSTSNTTIAITAVPTATIDYPAASYCPTGSSTATVTLTGATDGDFSSTDGLIIDDVTGDVDVVNSDPGTYTVTYTLPPAAGCSAFTTSTTITIASANKATIQYPEDVYCVNAGVASVGFDGTTGGTFSSTAGLSINDATGDVTLASSTPGTYIVKYSGAASNGCAAFSDTTIINILASSPATISYAKSAYCTSDSIASATITGTATGTFSSTAGLLIDNVSGEIDLQSSTPGTYTVTYSLGGCSTNTTVTINGDPSGTAIAYGTAPFCKSVSSAQPATIMGTTGGVFSSSAGLSLNSSTGAIIPSTSTAGTYTVKYDIAATACPAYSTTIPVTVTAVPSATVSYAGTPYCTSLSTAQNITLTGTAGGSFASFGGLAVNSSTGAITPSTSTPGNYTVFYSIPASGGCAAFFTSTPATITVAPSAAISYSGTPFCKTVATAQPVTRTGTSGGTYSAPAGLSLNAATGAITPSTSTAGTYTVTYTIAAFGGCAVYTTTASVTITAPPAAVISYAGTPFCTSTTTTQPVTITGSPGGTFSSAAGLSLNASTGAITPSASIPGSDSVIYSIAASGGCAAFSTTTSVIISLAPSATISYVGGPYCNNAGIINVISTGTAGGTYSSTAGLSITPSTGAINVSASAPGTYTITYTVAGCSTYTATTSIVITPIPSATISYTGSPYCTTYSNAPVTLTGTTGGTFSSTAGLSINSSTGAISPVSSIAGTYTVTYTVAAAGGCSVYSKTTKVTVTPPPPASISYPGSPYCGNAGIATVVHTGAIGGTYTSTPGLTLDVNTGDIDLDSSTPGIYTVTYSITPTGCSLYTTTTTVTVKPGPSATIVYANNPYCREGDIAILVRTGTPGGTFSSTAGLYLNSSTGSVIVDSSAEGSYTVTYSVPPANGCLAYSITTPVTINFTSVWNGNVSKDWFDMNNWDCAGIPTITKNALIPAARNNYPVIGKSLGFGAVKGVTIETGASITVLDQLKIAGEVNNSGLIYADSGAVGFFGSTAQIIPRALFANNLIQDLIISNPAGVFLTGPLRVTSSVAFGSVNNSVFTTGDSLTLASVATGDASIRDITNGGINSGNVVSGDVIVERYMPAKRAYRFLTAPVNSTGSIKANWMENAVNPDRYTRVNPNPGFGINITGAGDVANGFDATQTHNPSVFTFNNSSQTWVPLPNTNGLMSVGNAYRVIVRGDRNIDMNTNTPVPTITTLRAKGTIMTGSITMTKPAGGGTPGMTTLSSTPGTYSLIANPYPAAVNWLTATKTDIAGTIYIFDPNVAGSYQRGGYVVYNSVMGTTSDNTSLVDNYLQSGQSFFVQAIGPNPTVTFKETDKATFHRSVFRTENTDPNIAIQLLLPSQQGSPAAADGTKVYFSDNYDNNIGNEDSYKFTNQDENLAILSGATPLCIEGRKPITGTDSIRLKLWQLSQKSYLLKVKFNNFNYNVEAYLKDKYLSTLTQLNTNGETIVPVSITSDAASIVSDRYKIVFEKVATLPLHLLGIKAVEKNNGVEVGWTAESESNMDRYEVEKSSDGHEFVSTGTVAAKANPGPSSFYTWFDLVPARGDNYYRIKSVDKAGTIKYSSVAKVRLMKGMSGITVVPNPISGKIIRLQFTEVKKGSYTVSIFKSTGEKVYTGSILHNTGSANHTVELKSVLASGIYQLQVSDGEDKETISVLFQ
ncbi:MAG: C-terminal target protein [Segetibacter sp.]|nr:C-terminal target protein [Segetibacter sp.]